MPTPAPKLSQLLPLPLSPVSLSDMRYSHLVIEAGSLLAEMRVAGASFEDIDRAHDLLEHSNPQTIGAIIHDLQSQLTDLQRYNEEYGIDPYCFEEEEED